MEDIQIYRMIDISLQHSPLVLFLLEIRGAFCGTAKICIETRAYFERESILSITSIKLNKIFNHNVQILVMRLVYLFLLSYKQVNLRIKDVTMLQKYFINDPIILYSLHNIGNLAHGLLKNNYRFI
jgi:hypothetical protein